MKTTLLSIIFICLAFLAMANPEISPVELQNPIDSFIDIKSNTIGFIDKTAQLQFEDILSKEIAEQFALIETMEKEEKYTAGKYHYWVHFEVKNSSIDKIIPFYFKGNVVDSITFYIKHSSGDIQTLNAGRWTYGTQNQIIFPSATRVFVPLKLQPQEHIKCWVRLKNEYGFNSVLLAKLFNPTFEINKKSNSY